MAILKPLCSCTVGDDGAPIVASHYIIVYFSYMKVMCLPETKQPEVCLWRQQQRFCRTENYRYFRKNRRWYFFPATVDEKLFER